MSVLFDSAIMKSFKPSFRQLREDKDMIKAVLPGSRKIYVPGVLHNIQVAMREITLSPTHLSNGDKEDNPPVTIYDSSGPFTDENIELDIRKGLPRLREPWIFERNDIEQLSEVSSSYGQLRHADASLDALRFEHIKAPLRARSGANVTQLHYAKKGIITAEMEYVAIRENQRSQEIRPQISFVYIFTG